MTMKTYDVITYGRSSIDLYSNNIGSPFEEIKEFGAFVGGSPLNIAVGVKRLGLRSALLTAVGNDMVGKFLLHFLKNEGVETAFIPVKEGARTSAVILGIEPPKMSSTNSKSEPRGRGLTRILQSANWPWPPVCFLGS